MRSLMWKTSTDKRCVSLCRRIESTTFYFHNCVSIKPMYHWFLSSDSISIISSKCYIVNKLSMSVSCEGFLISSVDFHNSVHIMSLKIMSSHRAMMKENSQIFEHITLPTLNGKTRILIHMNRTHNLFS